MEIGQKRTKPEEEEVRVPLLQGCRSIDCYQYLNKIDEGSYGIVYRAKDIKTEEIVAIKKIKLEKEREGFPITALRELNTLISLKHEHIIAVKEVVFGNILSKIFVVMEFMDHELKSIIEDKKINFTHAQNKQLVKSILEAVAFMHERFVFHRDLKTSNLLYSNKGVFKVCDFGLARYFEQPHKIYTNNVVTLWYRAPELLAGQKTYTEAIDVWSVGCIMGELILKETLFPGQSELEMLERIFKFVGNPKEDRWPEWKNLPL